MTLIKFVFIYDVYNLFFVNGVSTPTLKPGRFYALVCGEGLNLFSVLR